MLEKNWHNFSASNLYQQNRLCRNRALSLDNLYFMTPSEYESAYTVKKRSKNNPKVKKNSSDYILESSQGEKNHCKLSHSLPFINVKQQKCLHIIKKKKLNHTLTSPKNRHFFGLKMSISDSFNDKSSSESEYDNQSLMLQKKSFLFSKTKNEKRSLNDLKKTNIQKQSFVLRKIPKQIAPELSLEASTKLSKAKTKKKAMMIYVGRQPEFLGKKKREYQVVSLANQRKASSSGGLPGTRENCLTTGDSISLKKNQLHSNTLLFQDEMCPVKLLNLSQHKSNLEQDIKR